MLRTPRSFDVPCRLQITVPHHTEERTYHFPLLWANTIWKAVKILQKKKKNIANLQDLFLAQVKHKAALTWEHIIALSHSAPVPIAAPHTLVLWSPGHSFAAILSYPSGGCYNPRTTCPLEDVFVVYSKLTENEWAGWKWMHTKHYWKTAKDYQELSFREFDNARSPDTNQLSHLEAQTQHVTWATDV